MNHLTKTLRSVTTGFVAAALLAGGLGATVVSSVQAAGCTVVEGGSTTVFPALQNAQSGYQSANPGCSLTLGQQGSSAGIAGLIGGTTGGVTFTAGTFDVAASSRAGKTSGGVNGGNEKSAANFWKIGGDAMTFAVASSSAMSFLTNITAVQVQGIWNNTCQFWDDCGLGGPHTGIIARSRDLSSGTYSDMLSFFAITAPQEANVVARVGLPRLLTSADDASAATQDFAIVYTSLSNLGFPGTKDLPLSGGAPLSIGNASTFVTPSALHVQNGTYPAPRVLYMVMQKFTNAGVDGVNATNIVKAEALVNYMASTAGQSSVANVGFVQVAPFVPIPNYDVNLDGVVSLPDLGQVTGHWGQSNSVPGWIRADANNDGTIALGDIGQITGHWGATGFVAPN